MLEVHREEGVDGDEDLGLSVEAPLRQPDDIELDWIHTFGLDGTSEHGISLAEEVHVLHGLILLHQTIPNWPQLTVKHGEDPLDEEV